MSAFTRFKTFYKQQNTQQFITLSYSVLTELICITISTLPIIFIPQQPEYTYLHIEHVFQNIKWYIITLFFTNIITWLAFIIIIIFEIYREIWLIRTFDYSHKYNNIHLAKYKNEYPQIFTSLETLNTTYYKLYNILKYITIINITYSIIIIMLFQYDNYQTITSLFTNSIISYNKIKKGLLIGKEYKNGHIGYAYHNIQHLSFNRIDSKIKQHHSNSDNDTDTQLPRTNNNIDDNYDNNQLPRTNSNAELDTLGLELPNMINYQEE